VHHRRRGDRPRCRRARKLAVVNPVLRPLRGLRTGLSDSLPVHFRGAAAVPETRLPSLARGGQVLFEALFGWMVPSCAKGTSTRIAIRLRSTPLASVRDLRGCRGRLLVPQRFPHALQRHVHRSRWSRPARREPIWPTRSRGRRIPTGPGLVATQLRTVHRRRATHYASARPTISRDARSGEPWGRFRQYKGRSSRDGPRLRGRPDAAHDRDWLPVCAASIGDKHRIPIPSLRRKPRSGSCKSASSRRARRGPPCHAAPSQRRPDPRLLALVDAASEVDALNACAGGVPGPADRARQTQDNACTLGK
jgi:hypothetical protein